jgi:ABC-type phosphate transport system substrate-binding protein
MRSFLARRRLWPLLALLAAVGAALVAPGGASATIGLQCSGEAVTGQGATLTKIAQLNIWDPDFNTSANAAACSGTQGSHGTPKVTYDSTASGAGLESWGVDSHSATFGVGNAFLDTEIAPSTTIKEEIESHGAPDTLLTIPLLQAAVAIPVHLPANCVATSTGAPGRLVLGNKTLEKIYRGVTTKWSEVTEDGDTLSGTGCEPASTIKRVVREDGAGSTAVLMKYLYLIYKKAVDGKETWLELAEGTNNTVWPDEATVLRAKGNSGVVAKVASEASSIGYADLADTRANGTFSPPKGGPGTGTFWPEVQDNGTGVKTFKVADPSTDGDAEAKANANCEAEVYTNGKVKFPPPSVESTWNEVTTKTTEKHYPICGFAYAVTLDSYHSYAETTEGEATTVENLLEFELNAETGGGQQLLNDNDFLGLPTNKKATQNVLKIAQEGAAKVTF